MAAAGPADSSKTPSPAEFVSRLYEQAEAEAAKATERLVASGGFAMVLGQLAQNVAAVTKLSADLCDQAVRQLRLAGRLDIIRLSRQQARTEDKLERVLQEVEAIRDRLDNPPPATAPQPRPARGPARTTGSKRPS